MIACMIAIAAVIGRVDFWISDVRRRGSPIGGADPSQGDNRDPAAG
jgi:hypothetical protein